MLETAAEAHKFKEQTMIKADDHLKLQKVASTFNEITTKNSNWTLECSNIANFDKIDISDITNKESHVLQLSHMENVIWMVLTAATLNGWIFSRQLLHSFMLGVMT